MQTITTRCGHFGSDLSVSGRRLIQRIDPREDFAEAVPSSTLIQYAPQELLELRSSEQACSPGLPDQLIGKNYRHGRQFPS